MSNVSLYTHQKFGTLICSSCKAEFLMFVVARAGICGIKGIDGELYDHYDEWTFNVSDGKGLYCPKCGELIDGQSEV